jgi:hypothetical protein
VAPAISAIEMDASPGRLDNQYHSHIHRLAPAGDRPAVGATGLGCAAGIRMHRGFRRNSVAAPRKESPTVRTSMRPKYRS